MSETKLYTAENSPEWAEAARNDPSSLARGPTRDERNPWNTVRRRCVSE